MHIIVLHATRCNVISEVHNFNNIKVIYQHSLSMPHISKSTGNEYQSTLEIYNISAFANTHGWPQVRADFYQRNCRYW